MPVARLKHVPSHAWSTETIAAALRLYQPKRVLVLFNGTGSVEQAVRRLWKHAEIITVDNVSKYKSTHTCDIRTFDFQQYPVGYFDVIWASPPCTYYSVARTTPTSPAQLQQADSLVQAAQNIINRLKPAYFFMENPHGNTHRRLALRPIMENWEQYRHMTSYCHYGAPYRKNTDIWTNAPVQLRSCTALTPCLNKLRDGAHLRTAQSGPSRLPDGTTRAGMGSAEAAYPLPQPLLHSLLSACT